MLERSWIVWHNTHNRNSLVMAYPSMKMFRFVFANQARQEPCQGKYVFDLVVITRILTNRFMSMCKKDLQENFRMRHDRRSKLPS